MAWVINAMRCGMGNVISDRLKGVKDLKNNAEYAANIKIRTDAVEAYKKRKLLPFLRIMSDLKLYMMDLRNMT